MRVRLAALAATLTVGCGPSTPAAPAGTTTDGNAAPAETTTDGNAARPRTTDGNVAQARAERRGVAVHDLIPPLGATPATLSITTELAGEHAERTEPARLSVALDHEAGGLTVVAVRSHGLDAQLHFGADAIELVVPGHFSAPLYVADAEGPTRDDVVDGRDGTGAAVSLTRHIEHDGDCVIASLARDGGAAVDALAVIREVDRWRLCPDTPPTWTRRVDFPAGFREVTVGPDR
ncbi:MAG: hypothetical protein H6699_02985 [Myxococcales bacterium]|nr:hypothetical protein [Myxococcales bacterium]